MVIAYDEEAQTLKVCTLLRDSLARRLDAALVVPWPLEEVNFKLDDEAARTLGGAMFAMLGEPAVPVTRVF
ncbi:hypothetical protein [Paraburkholderia acidiphila]|uniref:Uncharacterized protein n=1 Tax=Paraburkholderia acidiphila TaxID=2571747 RepID=A0A7Z2GE72_9BURK|nr:hypothetical protein [Paraburkholderia acidiphila]QGZ60121.1 hypothetical protein FAZ97_34990 [Paraburkholderia acidiphila]